MSSLGRAHRSGYTGASARNALRSFRPARVAPWSWIGRGRQIHASAAQGSGHQQRIQPCTNAGEGGCACEQHDPLPLTCFAGVEAGWEDPSSFSSALRHERSPEEASRRQFEWDNNCWPKLTSRFALPTEHRGGTEPTMSHPQECLVSTRVSSESRRLTGRVPKRAK
jgi:hypothetical protein